MPKSNETTVNQGSNGQFKTTIPKGLAESYELDGKQLEWKVASGNRLEVTIKEPDDD